MIGGLPAATGRKIHFTGTTVLKVVGGKIVEEIGLDDGVTALTQLELIKAARSKQPWRSAPVERLRKLKHALGRRVPAFRRMRVVVQVAAHAHELRLRPRKAEFTLSTKHVAVEARDPPTPT